MCKEGSRRGDLGKNQIFIGFVTCCSICGRLMFVYMGEPDGEESETVEVERIQGKEISDPISEEFVGTS